MQLTPFDKLTQNSFKLFDRGYRPLRPIMATSKMSGVRAEPGAALEAAAFCSWATTLAEGRGKLLCLRMHWIEVALGSTLATGACWGTVAVTGSAVTISCLLFSKK